MPWSDVEGESGGTPHVEIPITREQEITVSHGKDAMVRLGGFRGKCSCVAS